MKLLVSAVALSVAGCGLLSFPEPDSGPATSAPSSSGAGVDRGPRIEFQVTGATVAHRTVVADYPRCTLTGGTLTFRNLNDQSNPSLELSVTDFSFSATAPLTSVNGTFLDGTSLFPGPAFAASNCQLVIELGSSAQRLGATFTCGTLTDAAGNLAELSRGTLTCCLDCG